MCKPKLTDEKINRLVTMREEGYSRSQITSELNISPATISSYIKKLGLEKKKCDTFIAQKVAVYDEHTKELLDTYRTIREAAHDNFICYTYLLEILKATGEATLVNKGLYIKKI